ncbi:extracellular solute-binding protein [Cellulomonas cellasea]|uniref:ABC transporter substrate-binding protein n=1 Tax=Cellulomonas cellasea TaxID=43670 RepID=UPI0025A392CA|nr:extracellular solute-binding protein [Cellulomonas cellasea]MDM8086034.1 extracellular solute-binding protein [Cellulomonas cellasea]
MTRSHRRAWAIATAGALALGLAACGSGEETEDDTASDLADKRVGAMADYGVGDQFAATEPVSFSLLYREHPDYPYDPEWTMAKELTERTGVSLDLSMAPLSDFEQRRSLVIGGGDAPLIMPVTYPGQETPFVAAGAILPVSDYLDLMPNFQDKVEKWGLEADIDRLRQEDGKFYLLPGLLEDLRPDYSLALRTDVLDELGLKEPATWDDLHDVLLAVKQAHPDAYPLSDRFKGKSLLNYAATSFGTVAGWGFGSGAAWDPDAEEFVYAATTPEYRELLTYLHSLVEHGLLDPESFTQEDDAAVAKLVTGKSFAISTNAQLLAGHRKAFAEAGDTTAQIAKIRVPKSPAGDLISGERLESGVMISAEALESENFVALLQFVDWLYYSDAGLEFATWGVEGTTFEKGADGSRTLTADVDFVGLNPSGTTNLRTDHGFFNGVFLLAQGSTTELAESMQTEEEIAWRESMRAKDRTPVPPPYPLNEVEREQVSLYQSALTDYVDQNTLQFILGSRDLSTFDAFVTELEGMNLQAFLDVVNNAQKRYAEANG